MRRLKNKQAKTIQKTKQNRRKKKEKRKHTHTHTPTKQAPSSLQQVVEITVHEEQIISKNKTKMVYDIWLVAEKVSASLAWTTRDLRYMEYILVCQLMSDLHSQEMSWVSYVPNKWQWEIYIHYYWKDNILLLIPWCHLRSCSFTLFEGQFTFTHNFQAWSELVNIGFMLVHSCYQTLIIMPLNS